MDSWKPLVRNVFNIHAAPPRAFIMVVKKSSESFLPPAALPGAKLFEKV
jgi:hypothetical protein